MNYSVILHNALMVLRDLADYLHEENIDITTARRVMECQGNIPLPSQKIAYIASQCGIAGGLVEAVYNAQMCAIGREAIDWLEDFYSTDRDVIVRTLRDGRVVLDSINIEL